MMFERDELIAANKELRAKDESYKWPINGRFNATERAIKYIRKLVQDGMVIDSIDEYKGLVEMRISDIVNDSNNW
jgi:hypothetical protein